MNRHFFSRLEKQPLATLALSIVVLILVGLTSLRCYRNYAVPSNEINRSTPGMFDFHNGGYFPTLAFKDGINPYGVEAVENYPITRQTPPFSPLVFIVHLPFTFLSVAAADVAFFCFNLLLLSSLSVMAIRMSGQKWHWFWFFLLTTLLMLSRPGHITLFTGYFTLLMVIGTTVAIHFARERPVLSGFGIMFASCKPTFILPLVILMAWRKDLKAITYGILFSCIVGVVGLAWMASNSSLNDVVDGILEGQRALEDDVSEYPVNTWTRTDLVGMGAKLVNANPGGKIYLAAMVVILSVPGYVVYRISNAPNISSESATSLCGVIMPIAILLSIYHHSYDCLLIAVPWFGLLFFGQASEMGNKMRWLVAALLAVPAGNYLSTISARKILDLEQLDPAWQAITMINGICLLLALLILMSSAMKILRESPKTT